MAKQLSSLRVSLFASTSGLTKGLGAGAASVNRFVASIASAGVSLAKFTGIASAVGAGIAAIGSMTKGFKLAAEFEQVQVSIETMLGSATAANKVMNDLKDFASSTPFEFPELASSAKKLLAFGIATDKLMPTLSAVGDVASGVGMRIDELAEIYGKAKVQGTLMAEDINQLTGRGIPIIGELAKQLGVAESQVKKMVSEGKVGFPMLEKAFADLSGEGGKFSGMMEKQSGTLGGLMSSLSDTVGFGLMRIAQTLIDTFNLKDAVAALTRGIEQASAVLISWVQRIAPTLKAVGLTIVNVVIAAYNALSPVVTQIFNVVSSIWQSIYQTLASIASTIVTFIVNNWSALLQSTIQVHTAIWGVIRSVWDSVNSMLASQWTTIVSTWNSATSAVAAATGNSTVRIVDAFAWVADRISLSFNALEYALIHWRETFSVHGAYVMLGLVKLANFFEWHFTVRIPAYLNYFLNLWKAMFTDAYESLKTILANIGRNVLRFFANLPFIIIGKVDLADIWIPLTDGFESAVAKMYEAGKGKGLDEIVNVPERIAGDIETALGQYIDRTEFKLNAGLGEFLSDKQQAAKESAASIGNSFNSIVEATTAAISPPDVAVSEIKLPAAPSIPPVEVEAQLVQDELSLAVVPKVGTGDMIRVGSAESQRARFLGGYTRTAIGAVGGLSTVETTAPTAAPTPGMRRIATDFTEQLLNEARKHTTQFDLLIQNTNQLRAIEAI